MASVAVTFPVNDDIASRLSPIRRMAYASRVGEMFIHGPAARRLSREAAVALERFALASWFVHNMFVIEARMQPWVNADQVRELFRSYALQQGENVDALLEGAARHFQTDQIKRRAHLLTGPEVEVLVEDDQRAHRR
jgi:hypothetical protein